MLKEMLRCVNKGYSGHLFSNSFICLENVLSCGNLFTASLTNFTKVVSNVYVFGPSFNLCIHCPQLSSTIVVFLCRTIHVKYISILFQYNSVILMNLIQLETMIKFLKCLSFTN